MPRHSPHIGKGKTCGVGPSAEGKTLQAFPRRIVIGWQPTSRNLEGPMPIATFAKPRTAMIPITYGKVNLVCPNSQFGLGFFRLRFGKIPLPLLIAPGDSPVSVPPSGGFRAQLALGFRHLQNGPKGWKENRKSSDRKKVSDARPQRQRHAGATWRRPAHGARNWNRVKVRCARGGPQACSRSDPPAIAASFVASRG